MPVFHVAEVRIWLRTPPRPAADGGRRRGFFSVYGRAPIRTNPKHNKGFAVYNNGDRHPMPHLLVGINKKPRADMLRVY